MSEVRVSCQRCKTEDSVIFDLGAASALGNQPMRNHASCTECGAQHGRDIETGAIYYFLSAEDSATVRDDERPILEVRTLVAPPEVTNSLPSTKQIVVWPAGDTGEVLVQVLDDAGEVLAFGVGASEDDALLGIIENLRYQDD
jgi:hypothetical protein